MVGLMVVGSEIGRMAPGARRGEDLMVQAAQKITLSCSQDIPFDKLVLSQSNVRRNKAGVSVDELADDIARRGLLQGLSVRPVLDADGVETGKFEIPDGGRRFQALSLLVKQKRLAKTAPVPCVLRDVASATFPEDDYLAENKQRVALHPLDRLANLTAFRRPRLTPYAACRSGHDRGQAVEERRGHLGVTEDGRPFAEGQIGGDRDRRQNLLIFCHEVGPYELCVVSRSDQRRQALGRR